MLETWVRVPCEKKSQTSVNQDIGVKHRALFPTFCGLSRSCMHKETAKYSDSCKPAWLEMDEKGCPTTTSSYKKNNTNITNGMSYIHFYL